MRSVQHFWNSVDNSTTYISPARAYSAGGQIYINQVQPYNVWAGPSNVNENFPLPEIRTVYVYLSETITTARTVTIYGKGNLPNDLDFYPIPAEISEEIEIETGGKYESTRYYSSITKIEISGALTSASEDPALLSVGLGSKGYTPLFNTDTNSSSPMHYTLQIEVDGGTDTTTHQGFLNARNPVQYLPSPPVGHIFPNFIEGWTMYAASGVSTILSSIDNFTANLEDGYVGALAPVSIIWVYINDPIVEEEAQDAQFYITFLQQGSHA